MNLKEEMKDRKKKHFVQNMRRKILIRKSRTNRLKGYVDKAVNNLRHEERKENYENV